MDTKLTLKLNHDIIEKAKEYALNQKTSLSRLIENYLHSLILDKTKQTDFQISPFVKSLSTDINLPAEFDYKKGRTLYYEEKHR